MTDDLELRALVAEERYSEAERHCREQLAAGGDELFWTTRLGYVCFLDEADPVAYYERSVELFSRLAESHPDDVNALFWSGYLRLVVVDDVAGAVSRLDEVRRRDPRHPYAPLVLSGSATNPAEKRELLNATLAVQPSNFRALRDLAQLSESVGDLAGARALWARMTEKAPHAETGFGIMNAYVNDVLTGATHAQTWAREAKRRVES